MEVNVIIDFELVLIVALAAATVWRRFSFTRFPLAIFILHHVAMLAIEGRVAAAMFAGVLALAFCLAGKAG